MSTKARNRHDFIVKDLVISVPSAAGSHGGTFLPADDGTLPPWWISPIASVLVKGDILEVVRETVRQSIKDTAELTSIGRAFAGDRTGNPAISSAIHDIGAAVVASAAYSALGGGSVGLPNPDCGGSSLETIPTPITPIVLVGREVHQVSELPGLRKQLAVAVEAIDRFTAAQAPRDAEIGVVRTQLEGALKSLG